jgi:hypothetical protein
MTSASAVLLFCASPVVVCCSAITVLLHCNLYCTAI